MLDHEGFVTAHKVLQRAIREAQPYTTGNLIDIIIRELDVEREKYREANCDD